MPSGNEEALLQQSSYQPADSNTVSQAHQGQEAQFSQLNRDLEAERQNVTAHLERFRIRDPEDGSATYSDYPYIWRPTQINSVIPEDSEFDPKMAESHLHYYPDHDGTIPDYIHEGMPEMRESYSLSYETSTSTNGHHGDVDGSSNNSTQSSNLHENASLISRTQSQTKTQQVHTVTKVIKSREIHHNCPPYHAGPPVSSLSPDYLSSYGAPSEANDYGTYGESFSDRPPSPAKMSAEMYPHFNDYEYYTHSENIYPENLVAQNSPNMHRAMPQAPRSAILQPQDPHTYKQPVANYEDIDNPGFSDLHPAALSSPYVLNSYELPNFENDPEARTLEKTESLLSNISHPIIPGEDSNMHSTVGDGKVRYRNPSLNEVIEFLSHPDNLIRSNAAAYLIHLTFMNSEMKNKITKLGAIPVLMNLINSESKNTTEIQKNACSVLKNLSYGKNNNIKQTIASCEGISCLLRLLRKSIDADLKQLVTAILWNLSSAEELKTVIIDESSISILANHVIIPMSGWTRSVNVLTNDLSRDDLFKTPHESHSTIFRNASGVLRNLSSVVVGRQKIRECPGVIEASIYMLRSSINSNAIDSKSVANICCLLRNLSFKLEAEEDTTDTHKSGIPLESRASASFKAAVSDHLGCFGTSKKRDKGNSLSSDKSHHVSESVDTSAISGTALLYQPEVSGFYLALLSESSNPETLESSAGAIYNLTAGHSKMACDIRSSIRKSKGLPVLVELLRIEDDKVCCASATALRNLAIDARNRDLIGNYAFKDLLFKLPNGSPLAEQTSNATIAAVLAVLNDVSKENADFTRSLLSLGAIERLTLITSKEDKYSPKVVKLSSELLFSMYQHTELRDAFRKAGWKESHFLSHRPLAVRGHVASPTSVNNTLTRPMNSQDSGKYDDQTLPHGTELNCTAASVPYSRSEELPLNELSQSTEAHASQIHRSHIFPTGMPNTHLQKEPVYAKVNRDKKKGRHLSIKNETLTLYNKHLLSSDQADMPAGDSWV